MKVFLCRHGRTEHNEEGIVQGHKDVELSDKGRDQSELLGEHLQNKDIDHIYSSPLLRAKETAEEVAGFHNIEIETMGALKEVDQGVYEGQDARRMMENMWGSDIEDHKWAPEDGESMEDARERAMKCLESLKHQHKNQKVVIVAHGGFNKTMILGALGHSSKNFNRIKQDNCCVNEISMDDDFEWVVEKVNDTNHLE